MQRFLTRVCLGAATVAVPLSMCSCRDEPERKLGDAPPGAIGMNDPRWKGVPEEVGNERGMMNKKIYRK